MPPPPSTNQSLVWSPAPYHIISYGTLLGTQFFHEPCLTSQTICQTFVNAMASFKVLEREQFAILQRAIFPAYFGIQTTVPVVLALTYPGSRIIPSGIAGVLNKSNRWSVLAPLATACVTGLVNWAYFLPATNRVTAQRRRQEKHDSKKSWDAPPHSKEMMALNKRFGVLHGLSSFLNLITLGSTVVYGLNLANRIY